LESVRPAAGRAANSQLETTVGREFQGLRATNPPKQGRSYLAVNYPCKSIISCTLK